MSVTISSIAFSSSTWCTTCRRNCSFEQPVCAEGHGSDCPEWFCVDCGLAVVLGLVGTVEPAVTDRSAA